MTEFRSRAEVVRRFARCADGDREAWGEFLREFGPLLESLVRRGLARGGPARPEDCEECVQEIHAALLRDGGAKLRAYDGRSAPSTWLGLVALTAVHDRLRKAGRRPVTTDDSFLDRLAAVGGEPGERLAAAEESGRLLRAMESLPFEARLALRLVHDEGLTAPQAGRILGKSAGAVLQILSRSRRALRETLSRPG